MLLEMDIEEYVSKKSPSIFLSVSVKDVGFNVVIFVSVGGFFILQTSMISFCTHVDTVHFVFVPSTDCTRAILWLLRATALLQQHTLISYAPV